MSSLIRITSREFQAPLQCERLKVMRLLRFCCSWPSSSALRLLFCAALERTLVLTFDPPLQLKAASLCSS